MEDTVMIKQLKVVAALFAIAAFCTGSDAAEDPAVKAVPDALKVPSGQVLVLEAMASGVQIYECRPARSHPLKPEWVFKSPEAELFDTGGRPIGKHYAGPTWEADDGSKVVGEVAALFNSPDANSIPWLLLKAKSNMGSGIFTKVSSIQRLNTSGGKPTSMDCEKEQLGRELRVPYKALYYFYIANPQ